jgi:hypothetical protein
MAGAVNVQEVQYAAEHRDDVQDVQVSREARDGRSDWPERRMYRMYGQKLLLHF